jgi:hypothetical protein
VITSFEVGSIFKIIDQASPSLKKILKGTSDLDAAVVAARKNLTGLARTQLVGLTNQFKGLTKETIAFDRSIMGVAATIGRMSKASEVFVGVRTEIAGVSDAVGLLAKDWERLALAAGEANIAMRAASRVRGPATAASRMTALVSGTDAATASATRLADVWLGIADEIRGSAVGARLLARGTSPVGGINPRTRVAGPHGRGGGGGMHVSSLPVPLPGGHARISGGNAMLAGAGAIAYGAYEEAEFEDAAFRAMYTAGGIPADRQQRAARAKQLRDLVQSTTTKTGAPIGDVEEALLSGLRQFAGMPWDKRMAIMPDLLEGAASEARLKGHGTTVTEGMEVFTGLAHMTKEYEPEQIRKLIPKFAYLSTVDPEKIKQMEKAASYAVPILQSGLDVDPFDTMLLVASMQRGGVTNTKAGTWIREMAVRAMPGTSLMSKRSFKMHEESLRKLGLVDEKGQPTWFTDGKPDIIKLLDTAGSHAQEIPLTERAAVERQLFGAQGSGAFSVLSDPAILAQVHKLREEMENFKAGAEFFQEYSANSPAQQFRTAWADLQKVLMDIGQVALPPVVSLLQGFDKALTGITSHLPSLPSTEPSPDDSFHTGLNKAIGRGEKEGAVAGAAMAWPIKQPILGGAIGAFIGGAYEGGKFTYDYIYDSIKERWGLVGSPSSSRASGIPTGGGSTAQESSALSDGRPTGSTERSAFIPFMLSPGSRSAAPATEASPAWLAGAASAFSAAAAKPSEPLVINLTSKLVVDGRQMAEIVTKYIAKAGAGPVEGAPYHDATHSFAPPDFVLV